MMTISHHTIQMMREDFMLFKQREKDSLLILLLWVPDVQNC
jgi:hypothetical protein